MTAKATPAMAAADLRPPCATLRSAIGGVGVRISDDPAEDFIPGPAWNSRHRAG